MMPLNHLFRKCAGSNKFTKSQEKIKHHVHGQHQAVSKIEERIRDSKTNNKNIQLRYMESEEKSAMLIMGSGKSKKKPEGIKLPNQKRIRTLGEKENYKYLRIADTIK